MSGLDGHSSLTRKGCRKNVVHDNTTTTLSLLSINCVISMLGE